MSPLTPPRRRTVPMALTIAPTFLTVLVGMTMVLTGLLCNILPWPTLHDPPHKQGAGAAIHHWP